MSHRHLKATAPVLLALMFLTACGLASGGYSDLRNDYVKQHAGDYQTREKARLLVEAMQATYGGREAWRAVPAIRVEARYEWPSVLKKYRSLDNDRFRLTWRIGTDDSRLRFLNGKSAGRILGIGGWATYVIESEGAEPRYIEDEDIKFWLPTLQYFMEAPFRLSEASVLLFAGTEEIHGLKYDLVFATWGGPEPRKNVDQYLLYIERDSKQLRFLEYTVRDKKPGARGTMMYTGLKPAETISLPSELTKIRSPRDPEVIANVWAENFVLYLNTGEKYFMPDPSRARPKYR